MGLANNNNNNNNLGSGGGNRDLQVEQFNQTNSNDL